MTLDMNSKQQGKLRTGGQHSVIQVHGPHTHIALHRKTNYLNTNEKTIWKTRSPHENSTEDPQTLFWRWPKCAAGSSHRMWGTTTDHSRANFSCLGPRVSVCVCVYDCACVCVCMIVSSDSQFSVFVNVEKLSHFVEVSVFLSILDDLEWSKNKGKGNKQTHPLNLTLHG